MKDNHEIPFYFKVVELEAAGDITDRTVRVLTPQDKSIGPISTCVAVVYTYTFFASTLQIWLDFC